eukprot:g13296.t2
MSTQWKGRFLDAFIVALGQARGGEHKRWYAPTLELQLASLELCRVCRSIPTLNVRISDKTPVRLWVTPKPRKKSKKSRPLSKKARMVSRVPIVRALRLTWELPMDVLLRYAAAELWKWSESLSLVGEVSESALKSVVWPAALKELILDAVLDIPLEAVPWPPALQHLGLGRRFDGSIAGIEWPSSLQRLSLGDIFNQPIAGVVWPTSLQQLSFGVSFNKSLLDVVWPSSLRKLSFGPQFNKPITRIAWPATLLQLSFGREFDQAITAVEWPKNLQQLEFGKCFKHDIAGVVWPSSLQRLAFGAFFNRPIEGALWPSSLLQLSFGKKFDQPITGVAWPASLRQLSFGHRFNQPIVGVVWPTSLRQISLGSRFNQPIAGVTRCDHARTRRGIAIGSASGVFQRQVGLSCLRGGSGDEGDSRQTAEGDGSVVLPTATNAQVDRQAQQTPAAGFRSQERTSTGSDGGRAVFGGVDLVTERSTAAGGSSGSRYYSVLPDGTLRVRPHSQSPTSVDAPLPTATPRSRDDTTRAPTTPCTATITAASTGPRRMLQGLRRRTTYLKAGFGQAAVAAGGCAARAGVAVRGGLAKTFLPVGFPASVRPEYVRYRCWDIVQDLSSHLRGVLATQAVLEGMGVGRAGSTPLAATLQWMARDGASMIGGLLFTSLASANFGVNIKTWRLFADASNDIGLALEMLAPLPAFREGGRFLRLICVASVFKAACGVAGGATGAAITEHWAVDNNIADIGAKNGAQHTVASLLGLGLSVWFASAVSGDAGSASGSRVWGWYLALTVVHLLSNYAAMRTLALRSLNPTRASLLVTEYLRQAFGPAEQTGRGHENRLGHGERGDGQQYAGEERQEAAAGGGGGSSIDEKRAAAPSVDWMGRTKRPEFPTPGVLSPLVAARRERIIMLPGWVRAFKPWGDLLKINVGVPVQALVREADDLLWLTSLYHDEKAMVEVEVSYKPLGARMETKVNLALREDASATDRLQAMFQANVIHRRLVRDPDSIPQGGDGVNRTFFLRKVTEEALRVTRKEFPAFRKALEREGWDLSRVTLGGGPWVARWGSLGKED